jgi:hypothetical protein
LVPPTVKICPECGHIFEPTKKELEEGEMVHITAEYDKIRGKRIADLTPKELALYAKFTNKKPFAARVAKAKGKEYCSDYAKEMNSKLYNVKFSYTEIFSFSFRNTSSFETSKIGNNSKSTPVEVLKKALSKYFCNFTDILQSFVIHY